MGYSKDFFMQLKQEEMNLQQIRTVLPAIKTETTCKPKKKTQKSNP